MNLAAPAALLLGVLAVPIVALYILKLRRREMIVGSTFLWTDAMRDMQASTPWQRLRANLLLFLQLAALAAIVLALSRPYVTRAGSVSGNVIVVLDASARMRDTDVPTGNRFDAARTRVQALIDNMGSGDVMTLIAMARTPRVIVAQSGDHTLLSHSLGDIGLTDEQPDVAGAFSLAAALVRPRQHDRLVVLTGADTPLPPLPAGVSWTPEIDRVGTTEPRDLAISAFATAAQPNGTVAALARISNNGAATARSDVNFSVDGRLIDVRPVVVAAHASVELDWATLPAGAAEAQVQIMTADQAPNDKIAWAAVPRTARERVLLVTAGNVFLQTALSLDSNTTLDQMTPAAYKASGAGTSSYDLTVFDGVAPLRRPDGNILLIAPPASTPAVPGMAIGGSFKPTTLAVANDTAGLTQYVHLADIHVAQARVVAAPGWLNVAAMAQGRPILLYGDAPPGAGATGGRAVVLSFDIHDSDLPLLPDFPVLMDNMLSYLLPRAAVPLGTVRPGDPVDLVAAPGATAMDVVGPDGHVTRLAPPFPAAPFAATDQLGDVYRASTNRDGAPIPTTERPVSRLTYSPCPLQRRCLPLRRQASHVRRPAWEAAGR